MADLVINSEWSFASNTIAPNANHLIIGHNFNEIIEPGIIPTSVTTIFFIDYRRSILAGALPPSLTHLYLDNSFNQPLVDGLIPRSVSHLEFGCNFNKPLSANSLPPDLTYLKFGHKFDQALDFGVVPLTVTCIEFGEYFYKSPDSISVALSVKIVAKYSNYRLFMQMGFYKIEFTYDPRIKHEFIIDDFRTDDNCICGENEYNVVKLRNIQCVKISLTRCMISKKSARKF